MRFLRLFFFLTLLSTFFHSKDSHAGLEHPFTRGLVVGGATFGLMGLGGITGGFVGSNMGSGGFDSLAYASVGLSVGSGIVAPIGAFLVAKPAGANPQLVARHTLIASVIFTGTTIFGMLSENVVLFYTGLLGGLVVPTVAGISAARNPGGDGLSIAPVISPEYQGLVAGMRF